MTDLWFTVWLQRENLIKINAKVHQKDNQIHERDKVIFICCKYCHFVSKSF
jgi:hypothetical protein